MPRTESIILELMDFNIKIPLVNCNTFADILLNVLPRTLKFWKNTVIAVISSQGRLKMNTKDRRAEERFITVRILFQSSPLHYHNAS